MCAASLRLSQIIKRKSADSVDGQGSSGDEGLKTLPTERVLAGVCWRTFYRAEHGKIQLQRGGVLDLRARVARRANERKFRAVCALHKLRRAQVHAIGTATVRQLDVAIDEYSGAVSVGALDDFSGKRWQGSGGELFSRN